MKVGLFIPCYVDALYPQVGVATYKLLTSLGVDIDYPLGQTCCGQPMANAGFQKMGKEMVRRMDDIFAPYDVVVAPSASCAAFVRIYHPEIVRGTDHECMTSKKITDLVEFLHDTLKVKSLPARFPHIVSIHNSCHGVRELGLSSPSERNVERFSKVRDLLELVDGITIREPERPDECCGFGGMFSIEEPAVSVRMGTDKLRRHMATGAEYITGPDSSCLMHMQGIAKRTQAPIQFIHVAEILSAGL